MVEVVKHIMTFAGVEILGKVKSDDEIELARLETVKNMLQNAFVPLSVKNELENERGVK